MKKVFSFNAFLPALLALLLALWIVQAPSSAQAQARAEQECAPAQSEFVSSMELFRSAYFLREQGNATAEEVMEDSVLPAAERVYQVCPEEIAAVIRGGVERTNLSLSDPRRWELVACDKALIGYQDLLRRYDSLTLGDYNDYRNLIYHDISPAARAAVEACPQMPELDQQTRLEISERQRRLDSMEDIDNQGPTYWETRDNMQEYLEAYEDAAGN